MHMTATMADTMLHTAVTAVQQGDEGLHQVLDALPAAIYVTNAEGMITYYTRFI
jgi:PAS domain-containing protein